MKELNRMTIEFIQVCQQIDSLYSRKRELEANMKKLYESKLNECSSTGKTIDSFEEV